MPIDNWQLHSTYVSLIAPNLALPLGTILMTQFFKGIPQELEDAAEVDGASRWVVYSRIMVPMSIPALTTLGIVTFLWTWNSYLWPLVTAQSKEMYTITVGLASTQQGYIDENTGRIMAQGVLASLPVVIVFLVFQRYLRAGDASGAASEGGNTPARARQPPSAINGEGLTCIPPHAARSGAGA